MEKNLVCQKMIRESEVRFLHTRSENNEIEDENGDDGGTKGSRVKGSSKLAGIERK